MSLEFLLTSLIVVLIPGTGVLYTLGIGLSQGHRASIFASIGCTLGITPHILASIAGLTALLHLSSLVFQIFKFLGVAYLLYLAWNVLKDRGVLQISKNESNSCHRKVVLTGILLNILNPKLSLFFLAFLPQFVPVDASSATLQMLKLALAFMLMTLMVFIIYGICASATRAFIISKPSVLLWFRRGLAAAFCLLGAKLALFER